MNQNGFTLIEVLIGLFIAVVAALSVSQVIATTNKVVSTGRNTFIATNLAHEGLELTREIRDDTWLSTPNRSKWMSQSGLCPDTATHTYTIDSRLAKNNSIANDSDPDLYLHTVSVGGTTYQEWTHSHASHDTKTAYSRIMTIDCSQVNASPAFVTITATVRWVEPSGAKNASIKEILYNWLP